MAKSKYEAQQHAVSLCHVSPLAAPLQGYTFAVRTNLKKKLLTNRDALCVLFYVNGRLTLKQARDAMMTWRFGRATYKVETSMDYDSSAKAHRARATRSFGAWFNQGYGYGHCGHDLMDPGEWMVTRQYVLSNSLRDERGERMFVSRECRHFRRHYWYRYAPGHYAGSLEGVKRMSEMINESGFPSAWKKTPQ